MQRPLPEPLFVSSVHAAQPTPPSASASVHQPQFSRTKTRGVHWASAVLTPPRLGVFNQSRISHNANKEPPPSGLAFWVWFGGGVCCARGGYNSKSRRRKNPSGDGGGKKRRMESKRPQNRTADRSQARVGEVRVVRLEVHSLSILLAVRSLPQTPRPAPIETPTPEDRETVTESPTPSQSGILPPGIPRNPL